MNESRANDEAALEHTPNPRAFGDLVVAGLWIAIPTGVLLARWLFLPIFSDFGVALPSATEYLLHFNATILAALAAFIVVLFLFITPNGPARRLIRWIAFIAGALLVLVCVVAFLVPLASLWQNLS